MYATIDRANQGKITYCVDIVGTIPGPFSVTRGVLNKYGVKYDGTKVSTTVTKGPFPASLEGRLNNSAAVLKRHGLAKYR